MKGSFGLLVVTFSALGVVRTEGDFGKCDLCSCRLSNGSYVDFTQDGFTDGTARFSISPVDVLNVDSISFNPCTPFSNQSADILDLDPFCHGVMACVFTTADIFGSNTTIRTGYGKQNTSAFSWSGNDVVVTYYTKTMSGAVKNNLTVRLQCVADATVKPRVTVSQLDREVMTLTLSSNNACFKTGGDPDDPGSSGLSTGSILVIIFFTILLVYFFGGIVVNVVIRGAAGKEVLPHYAFWSSLPGLVVEGCTFVCLCFRCKASAGDGTRTYDDIS